MRKINADILQKFLISSILFLFFNTSLIKKCKALKIKIEVLNFVNDINILAYNKFIEEICKTLSRVHDVCTKWACTHDTTFASEKYELTHFIRKSKRFDMMTSIQIESSIIKLKSDVQVLKVQLNMKLQWDAHLHQIEVKDNLHKSKTDILSSNEIRNCIQSISLTSVRKRRKNCQTKNADLKHYRIRLCIMLQKHLKE